MERVEESTVHASTTVRLQIAGRPAATEADAATRLSNCDIGDGWRRADDRQDTVGLGLFASEGQGALSPAAALDGVAPERRGRRTRVLSLVPDEEVGDLLFFAE